MLNTTGLILVYIFYSVVWQILLYYSISMCNCIA